MPDAAGWLQLKTHAARHAQPLSANLELTYRCNWRCVFCYNPRHHDRRGLSAEEWTAVLDDLRLLGTLFVALTGGEPLAHPGFLDIARAARARRLAIRVFTNGSLVTEEMADALADLQPLGIELSLHGADAGTHDRATGRPGSYAAFRQGLERLHRRNVPLLVKTPLTSLNEGELEAMVALVEGLGVTHRIDASLTPRDDGDPSPLRLRASRAAVERLYALLARRGALPGADHPAGGYNCGLGRLTLAIDPEGAVYPCLQWKRTSLGNVRERPLREIWKGSPARQDAAQVALDANEAMRAAGGPVSRFPFCPALALQNTGDPFRPDDFHTLQAEAVARARDEGPRSGAGG
jgi:MoaA/NifB/PqqE/SkfB family radical SAM enzyme